MLKEISKKEFTERSPEINTYGLENEMPVYLENGTVLIDTEWNGEVYTVKEDGREHIYRPVTQPDPDNEDDSIVIGYEDE